MTAAYTSKGSKGRTDYNLQYRYNANGSEYTKSDTVGQNTYQKLTQSGKIKEGLTTFRVRYVGQGSMHFHVLIENGSTWILFGSMLFFVLFWNGVLSVFVYIAWVVPLHTRWLVRHGAVTVGKIVSRRTQRGKGTRYYATYRFREPVSGQDFEREMQLPKESLYWVAEKGMEVTVLYNPLKPKRSLVYELCGYRASGAESR